MEKPEFGLIAINIAYNFTFCLCCWQAHQAILKKLKQRGLNNGFVAAVAIVAVAAFSFVLDPLFNQLSARNTLLLPEIAESKRRYILVLRSLVISGLFYFIAYYLYMLWEKQRNLLEIAELKQAQLAASLSSLKEQLSPHFLFNTLNTLSTLTQEPTVKEFVAELAEVYRYVLRYKNEDTATLQQELDFIDSYLYIVKTRLEEAIEIEIDVGENLLHRKMPPLTLQLLLENAIKHNIASAARRLKITIKSSTGGDSLVVTNNLQLRTSVQSTTGIGLDNVRQRYRLLFDMEIDIVQTSMAFTVKLPLV